MQDAASQAQGSERTAVAREAEADALCKENTALKQQLRSLQQDCGRSRGAFHAVSAELAELKDSLRQVSGMSGKCWTHHLAYDVHIWVMQAGCDVCLLAKAVGLSAPAS